MRSILSMDLSKRSAGWAIWSEGLDKPLSGTWALGSEITSAGTTFLRLHRNMNDLYTVHRFDTVIYEEPLQLIPNNMPTNRDSVFALIGLAAHADSFCEAKNVKVRHVNQATWRRYFIGAMKRGTKTVDLKRYAMERCAQLGIMPAKHDAAEAIGILAYMCSLEGITPPWASKSIIDKPIGGLL